MSINMRRGLLADFDPGKMTAGEWAVSIDPESENQIVWMCFAPGVVKRMGTYEDFQAQIRDATGDIRDEYVALFNEIKTEIEGMKNSVSSDKDIVLQVKDDVITEYLPQMLEYVNSAEASKTAAATSEKNAAKSEGNAEDWAKLAESHSHGNTGVRDEEATDNAKYWAEQAKESAEKAAEVAGGDVVLHSEIGQPGGVAALDESGKVPGNQLPDDVVTVDDTGKIPETKIPESVGKVKGVKGNAEDAYREGQIAISPENLKLDTFDVAAQRAGVAKDDTLPVAFGKLAKYCEDLDESAFTGDTAENTVTFDSVDVADDGESLTEWTSINPLATGETHKSLFGKTSGAIKNVRYLWKLVTGLQESKLDIANVLNSLACTEEGFSLDARAGKDLQDQITSLNGNMATPVLKSGDTFDFVISSLNFSGLNATDAYGFFPFPFLIPEKFDYRAEITAPISFANIGSVTCTLNTDLRYGVRIVAKSPGTPYNFANHSSYFVSNAGTIRITITERA